MAHFTWDLQTDTSILHWIGKLGKQESPTEPCKFQFKSPQITIPTDRGDIVVDLIVAPNVHIAGNYVEPLIMLQNSTIVCSATCGDINHVECAPIKLWEMRFSLAKMLTTHCVDIVYGKLEGKHGTTETLQTTP